MALILDETFATGIPTSFATARAQSGTLSVTYDAVSQAVDLSNSVATANIWDITSVPLSASGEMEIDLELRADFSTIRHAGIWAVAGLANVSAGYRFDHYNATYEVWMWDGGSSWAGNVYQQSLTQAAELSFNTVGDRRILNLRWDLTTTAGVQHAYMEGRVDGNLLFVHLAKPTFTSLRPGIFIYQSIVRLHSIKAWNAPTAPLALTGSHDFRAHALGWYGDPPVEARDGLGVRNHSLRRTVGIRDIYFGGVGKITGSVFNTPKLPVNRRVILMDEATRLYIRETWSDAQTGAYAFYNLDPTRAYTVASYDYTGLYRAVITDNITPDLP